VSAKASSAGALTLKKSRLKKTLTAEQSGSLNITHFSKQDALQHTVQFWYRFEQISH
jgi:hypothetical protein